MIYDSRGVPVRRIESEQHKKDRAYYETFDIIKRKHKVPERVCILGPGVNAANEDAYKKITADYIIAVNYAVLISQSEALKNKWPLNREIDAWCIMAYDVEAVPWFKKMFPLLKLRRYFSTNTCIDVVGIPLPWNDDEFYTMNLAKRYVKTDDYDPARGKFQPSTTVIGVAASVAYECGAKYIELCGCDLFGNIYYDNTKRGLDKWADAPHVDCKRLESLLKYLEGQGLKIVSLSTTALDIPCVR